MVELYDPDGRLSASMTAVISISVGVLILSLVALAECLVKRYVSPRHGWTNSEGETTKNSPQTEADLRSKDPVDVQVTSM